MHLQTKALIGLVAGLCGMGAGLAVAPCYQWEDIGAPVPIGGVPRADATFDTFNNNAVMVRMASSGPVQFFTLRPTGWTALGQNNAPLSAASFKPALDYDRDRQTLVFAYGDSIFELDSSGTWSNALAPLPSLMSSVEGVYDQARRQMVYFGGRVSSGPTDRTMTWDGVSLTELTPATTPPPTAGHGMAYDAVRQRVVVFGGEVQGGVTDAVWEWDGAEWEQIIPIGAAPAARDRCSLQYDSVRQVVVLVGGRIPGTAQSYDDCWEWDGVEWRERQFAAPVASSDEASTFEENRGTLVIAGTAASHFVTVRLDAPGAPWVTGHPQSRTVEVGETASFTVDASDAPYTFQWRKNGVDMPGKTTPNLVLTNVQESDAAVYDCVVAWAAFAQPCSVTIAGPAALTVNLGCDADVTGDGSVNFSDLNEVLSRYNQACD